MGDGQEKDGKNVTNLDLFNLIQTSISQSNEIKNEITHIKNEMENYNQTTSDLQRRVHLIEREHLTQKNVILHLERKLRRNNIIMFGVPDTQNKSLLDVVLDIIVQQLEVDLEKQEVNNVFRFSKNKKTGPRPVVLELTTYWKKQQIMRNKARLKGGSVIIADDLSEDDRIKRRVLYRHYVAAKNSGQSARLFPNGLQIDGEYRTYDYLKKVAIQGGSDDLANPSITLTPNTLTSELNFPQPISDASQNQIRPEASNCVQKPSDGEIGGSEQRRMMNTRNRNTSKYGSKSDTQHRNKSNK